VLVRGCDFQEDKEDLYIGAKVAKVTYADNLWAQKMRVKDDRPNE